jgi:hypothetical protein
MASLRDAALYGKPASPIAASYGSAVPGADELRIEQEQIRAAQANSFSRGRRAGQIGSEVGSLAFEADKLEQSGNLAGAQALRAQQATLEQAAQAANPNNPQFTDFLPGGTASLTQIPDYVASGLGAGAHSFETMAPASLAGAALGGAAGFLTPIPGGAAMGAKLGGIAGASIAGYNMNTEEQAANLSNDPMAMQRTAAERLDTARATGAVNTALDLPIIGLAASKAGLLQPVKAAAGEAVKRYTLKSGAKDIGEGVGTEFLTGGAQNLVGQKGVQSLNPDKEISGKDVLNDAVNEAIGGGGMVAPIAAASLIKDKVTGGPADPNATKRTKLDRLTDGIADAGETVGKLGAKVVGKVENRFDKATAKQDDEHLARLLADAPTYSEDMSDADVVATADADRDARLVSAGEYANKVRAKPNAYSAEELTHAEQYVQALENGADPETAMNTYHAQLVETKRAKKLASAFEEFAPAAGKASKQSPDKQGANLRDLYSGTSEGSWFDGGTGSGQNTTQTGAASTPVTKDSNKAALQAKRDIDLQTWNDTLALVHKTLSSDKKSRLANTAQRDDVREGILGLGQWVKQGFKIEDEDGNMRVGVPDKFIENLDEDAPRVVKLTIDTLKEQGLIDAETAKLGEKMVKRIEAKNNANRGSLSSVVESFTPLAREELGKELPRVAAYVREQLRLLAKNGGKLTADDEATLSRWFGPNKAKLMRGFREKPQRLDEEFKNVTGEELEANPDMQEENEFSTKLAKSESTWRESELFDGEAKTKTVGTFDTRQPGTKDELAGKLARDFSESNYPNTNVQEIGVVEAAEYEHADDAAGLDAALQSLREKYPELKTLAEINKAVRTIQLTSLTENDKSVVKGEEFANLQPGQPNNKWAVSAGENGKFGSAAHGVLVFERVGSDGDTKEFNTSTSKLVKRGRQLDKNDGRTAEEASSDILNALSSGITALFEAKTENGRYALSGRVGYREKAGGPITWLDLATDARSHEGDTSEFGDVRPRDERMATAKEQGDSARQEARNLAGVGVGSKSGKLKTLGDKAFAENLMNGLPANLRLPSGATVESFREEAGRNMHFDKPYTEAFDFKQLPELSRAGLTELRKERAYALKWVIGPKLKAEMSVKKAIAAAIERQIAAVDEALKNLPAYRGRNGVLSTTETRHGDGSTFDSSEWLPVFTDQNGKVITAGQAFSEFKPTAAEPSKAVGLKADKLVTHLIMERVKGEEYISRTKDGKVVPRSANAVKPTDRGVSTGATESGEVHVGAPRSQFASTAQQRSERANSLPATEFEPKGGTRIENERPEGERNADQLPDGSPEPVRLTTQDKKTPKLPEAQHTWLMDTLRKGVPAFLTAVKNMNIERRAGIHAALKQMVSVTSMDSPFWRGKPPTNVKEFTKRANAALVRLEGWLGTQGDLLGDTVPARKAEKANDAGTAQAVAGVRGADADGGTARVAAGTTIGRGESEVRAGGAGKRPAGAGVAQAELKAHAEDLMWDHAVDMSSSKDSDVVWAVVEPMDEADGGRVIAAFKDHGKAQTVAEALGANVEQNTVGALKKEGRVAGEAAPAAEVAGSPVEPMNFPMKAAENIWNRATTTFDEIVAGNRTSTTRGYWTNGRPKTGQLLTFKSPDGRTVTVKVKTVTDIKSAPAKDSPFARQWSEKEGWTYEAAVAKGYFKGQQVTFELVKEANADSFPKLGKFNSDEDSVTVNGEETTELDALNTVRDWVAKTENPLELEARYDKAITALEGTGMDVALAEQLFNDVLDDATSLPAEDAISVPHSKALETRLREQYDDDGSQAADRLALMREAKEARDEFADRQGSMFNAQSTVTKQATPEEQAAIKKELLEVLGPGFEKVFVNFIKGPVIRDDAGNPVIDPKTGEPLREEWSGKWTEKGIRIALNAMDPLGTSRHESVHQLFKWLADHGADNTKEVLQNAATNPAVQAKLRRLLKGDTAAIEQLKDPEEAAAYLYQFWRADPKSVALGPKTETFFQKITKLFKELTGLVSKEVRDLQHAETIMQAFATGQLKGGTALTKLEANLTALRAKDAAGNRLVTAFNNQKQLQKYAFAAQSVLEDTKIPSLVKLSRILKTPTGGELNGQSMIEATRQERNKRLGQLNTIMEGVDEEDMPLILKELQSETDAAKIGDPVVRAKVVEIRNYLKNMYEYMKQRKMKRFNDVTHEWDEIPEYKTNYFPWVMDMDKLTGAEGGKAFEDKLLSVHMQELKNIAEEANNEQGKDSEFGELYASSNIKGREITPQDVAQAIRARYIAAAGAPEINESQSDIGITPYARSVNKRTLPWLDHKEFTEFTNQDLIQTLSNYTVQVVKRGEYTVRLGNAGEVAQQAIRDAYVHMLFNGDANKIKAVERAYAAAMKDWSERKKAGGEAFSEVAPTLRQTAEYEILMEEAMRLNPDKRAVVTGDDIKPWLAAQKKFKKDAEAFRDAQIAKAMKSLNPSINAVMAAEGTLGRDITPSMRSLISAGMVYQNARLMALSLFTSFGDPIGIVVNGGDVKQAWSAFTRGIRDVKRQMIADPDHTPDKLEELAVRLGTADAHQHLDALGQMYSSLYLHGKLSRINQFIFKWNGMEAYNRAMRIEATGIAMSFLHKHLTAPDANSTRRLKDYGLTEGKDAYMKNGELDTENPAVQAALMRWVNDAILSPDAMTRPTAASDQHMALFYHLKSFAYTFHKTTLKRAWIEAQNGNYNPAMALFVGYTPVMIAADAMKEMLAPGDEPAWMKGGLGDWLAHGFSRANLLGIPQFALDANPFTGNPAGLLGPTVDQAVGNLMIPFSDRHSLAGETVNAMPGAVLLNRATRSWTKE